jgi:hypothetical protein
MPSALRARLTFANVTSVLALFAALGGGAVAIGADANKAGEIRACYVKTGTDQGAVRLLVKGRCTRRERKITWSQRGPIGPQGVQGQRGLSGPSGSDGSIAGVAAGGDLTGAFPNPAIATGAITAPKIATAAVGTDALADGSVTTAKIPNFAVGQAQINGNSITSNRIVDGAVGAVDLADGAVSTGKLAANAKAPNADKLDGIDSAGFVRGGGSMLAAQAFAPLSEVLSPATSFVTIGSVAGIGTFDVGGSWGSSAHDCRLRFTNASGGNLAINGDAFTGHTLVDGGTVELAGLDSLPDGRSAQFTITPLGSGPAMSGAATVIFRSSVQCAGAVQALVDG